MELGLGQLYWHNFEHNRLAKALSIIVKTIEISLSDKFEIEVSKARSIIGKA